MKTSTKVYYQEIDSLKGIAIFFVVLAHSIILYPINLLENEYCNSIFRFISSTHMPLFFIVSGFCFAYGANYKDYILKKLYRLLIPYIVFNLADMLPRQLLPALINRPASMTDSLKEMLFYGGEYWFLYTLFLIFLIYPAIYLWQKNSTLKKLLVEMILLVIYLWEPELSFLCLNYVLVYLLFFNTGVLIREASPHIFEWTFKKPWMQSVTIALLLIVWGLSSNYPATIKLATVAGIVTCYLFTKFPWFNKTFRRFGEYSLQLYLLNGFLLVISRTFICKITSAPAIIICFNMLITFFLSYIFIKYFCQRFKWIRSLMGM